MWIIHLYFEAILNIEVNNPIVYFVKMLPNLWIKIYIYIYIYLKKILGEPNNSFLNLDYFKASGRSFKKPNSRLLNPKSFKAAGRSFMKSGSGKFYKFIKLCKRMISVKSFLVCF